VKLTCLTSISYYCTKSSSNNPFGDASVWFIIYNSYFRPVCFPVRNCLSQLIPKWQVLMKSNERRKWEMCDDSKPHSIRLQPSATAMVNVVRLNCHHHSCRSWTKTRSRVQGPHTHTHTHTHICSVMMVEKVWI
jgi:hypothetical protein